VKWTQVIAHFPPKYLFKGRLATPLHCLYCYFGFKFWQLTSMTVDLSNSETGPQNKFLGGWVLKVNDIY